MTCNHMHDFRCTSGTGCPHVHDLTCGGRCSRCGNHVHKGACSTASKRTRKTASPGYTDANTDADTMRQHWGTRIAIQRLAAQILREAVPGTVAYRNAELITELSNYIDTEPKEGD